MDGNRRFRIAVALLVAAAACSSSSRAERSSSTAGVRSSSTAPTPTTPTPNTATTPTTSVTGCTHAPVLHRALQYYGTPPPHGTSIDFVDAQLQQPAHDGRGDSFVPVGLGVEERRADGTVQLVDPEPGTSVVFRGFGDFDGDGRTDVLVDLYNATGNDTSSWIVRGTIAPGRHDPAKVGIRVPQSQVSPGAFPAAVGDQNHDGADDVRIGSALYSGRQLTAPGAGRSLPAPFRGLDAIPVGLLAIGAHDAPTFVVPDTATGSLRVLDARADRLLLDIATNDIPAGMTVGNNGQAGGWSVDGRTVVSFDISSRSGTTEWRWNLDDPCGR